MWGRLFRFILVILLAPMIAAVTVEAVRFVATIFTPRGVLPFVVGAIGFIFFYILFLSRRIDFFEHLEHELRHGIMSWLLSGKLPSKMVIEPEAKSQVEGVGGGCVMLLAPYLFPMLVLPILAIRLVLGILVVFAGAPIPSVALMGLDFLIGVTWGLHVVLVVKQFHFGQTDLKKVGRFFSTVMFVFLNFLFLVLILIVVTDSYTESIVFLKACWDTTREYYGIAWKFLTDTLVPTVKKIWQQFFLMLCKDCPRPTPTPSSPVGK